MREIRSAKCGMQSVDCGVEKADKIAFFADYTKPLEIIGPGRYMGIKSKHLWWSKSGR